MLGLVLILARCGSRCDRIRVMTFNIRFDNPRDGENAWIYRNDNVASMIRFHKADIAGLQEALYSQIEFLESRLFEYGWIGVGRDDGERAGEFSPIFYRTDRFHLLEQGTFWCSETPDKPGLGWDAACNRIVTYGKFKDRNTRKNFFVFNTHFDHMGEQARINSASLLLNKITEIADDDHVIVTGDFNADTNSEVYKILTSENGIGEGDQLYNSEQLSAYQHHGPCGTYTGFDTNLEPQKPIDFIFVRNEAMVIHHGTLSDRFEGLYPSDHFPVLTEIVLE
ncbi:endonuclease/exonuclease/phosphatase family protein [candidate division KSB1 bacterium]|nr:endonuclease/exonuclease/phosphatase family protein [candidate division KSB1 bacterium]